MDGFGVHTFRLVTGDGKTKLVKWHWKSMQGNARLVWEEAHQVAGMNADYHRQDLWDAIESGMYPEWEVRRDSGNFNMLPVDPAPNLHNHPCFG